MDDTKIQIVLKNFSYLVVEYNFEVENTELGIIYTYQNHQIKIMYDTFSYEILIIFENKISGAIFEIFDLLKYFNVKPIGTQVGDITKFEQVIKKIAISLKEYISQLLDDVDLYRKIIKQLEEDSKNYALSGELELTRKEVNIAWEKADYTKVVELFLPLKKHLSKSEQKKLEYAVKKIG